MFRRRCTEPSPNRLRGAVIGDTGDQRRIRLDGVEALDPDATAITAETWNPTADTPIVIEITASVDPDDPAYRTALIDLTPLLTHADVAPADWAFELTADGVTWPADEPAVLPVRAEAPADD